MNKQLCFWRNKKTTILLALGLVILSYPLGAFAVSNLQKETRSIENQIVNTKSVDVQVATVDTQEQNEERNENSTKSAAPRSEVAKQHMSVVAQKVEELLATRVEKGGIGEQVRAIAKEQNQAQKQLQDNLTQVETRPGWLKRLVGPDYKALKGIKQQLQQNQVRAQQLAQLTEKTQNKGEQTLIQQTIEALNQENTTLQDQVQSEEKSLSAFGWLVKIFRKY